MNKQYVITEAYTDNYHVLQYVDNKFEDDNIVSYYELDGYIAALHNMGYEEAYYVPEYATKVREAQEILNLAIKAYEKAKNSPLVLSEEEAKKYKNITHKEKILWD